ncbi:SDR family oxidoreductase [Paenibacillus sp. FSL H7-0350]|uniref:SDR family oxidoreductase n=1 Tax=Paenibacillus sp. FSL H7-0350 TaxID=2975345 RepID=UPI0031587AA1
MKKIALISGVASGIGKCVAENLSNAGVEVFGLDKSNINLDKINFYQCDISKESEVINCIREISRQTEKIDYLVNAAGIFCCENRYLIEDLPMNEWEKVFDVNLKGMVLLTKYTIPLMKKSLNGNIVNFSSEQVVMPQEKSAPYAVTKAAIEMFSKILAMELMANKIRVNTIAMASVRTNFLQTYLKDDEKINEMMQKSEIKMPFGLIEPIDVYELVKYLIFDNKKMTGQTLLMDSGTVLDINRKKKRSENNV